MPAIAPPSWMPLSPPVPHRLRLGVACGLSDTGTVRCSNEDNLLIDPALNLAAVADGMGGHTSGEVASAAALSALAAFLRDAVAAGIEGDPRDTLRQALAYANDRLYQANLANHLGDGNGMGTTLTGVWQPEAGGQLLVFHVGDSRLYRLRRGQLVQFTRDQTMYQQALEAGETGPLPARNLLLQALGPAPGIEPQVHAQSPAPGDLYLLCSDGLHGASADQRIAACLAQTSATNLEASCAQLVAMAKQDGSRDNITAVLIKCGE
jgi:protein phosphatase